MHSTRSVIVFVFIMTALVALILAGMYTYLKPVHDKNEALYNKKAILSAVEEHLDGELKTMSDADIQGIFDSQIEQKVLNMSGEEVSPEDVVTMGHKGGLAENLDMKREVKKPLDQQIFPLFIFTKSSGEKFYILYARGKGLWDEIWGNIAFEDDLNTIAGVAFDHVQETPGLGAEIKDNIAWKNQFVGKKIYGDDGLFRSVLVRKGGAKDPVYEVDGISGATITADGVSEMLERGLQYYEPYLNTIKG